MLKAKLFKRDILELNLIVTMNGFKQLGVIPRSEIA
jgi:hypothetical protein